MYLTHQHGMGVGWNLPARTVNVNTHDFNVDANAIKRLVFFKKQM